MREIACAICEGSSRRTLYGSTIKESDVVRGQVDPDGGETFFEHDAPYYAAPAPYGYLPYWRLNASTASQ